MTTADPLASIRARGRLGARFRRRGEGTHPHDIVEADGYRLRFPAEAGGLTAVTINTGGGMTGGDTLDQSFVAEEGADAAITSQAAEKLYRATSHPARMATRLVLEPGSRLDWIPQEAILFDGARLVRRIDVEMAGDARLLLAEQIVFGRLAMGERLNDAGISERWTVRRDGRLVFAEASDLDGALFDRLDRTAIGGGARAAATILLVGEDGAALLEPVRALMDGGGVMAGASAFEGMLVIRLMAADPQALRETVIKIIQTLRSRPMPRCW